MSQISGVRSGNQTLLNRVIPECHNIGRSIKTSATAIVVLIVIVLILMVATILYSYLKKVGNDGSTTNNLVNDDVKKDENKKKKVVGGLTITSTVLIFITAFIAVYQMSAVSRAARQCITV